MCVLYGGFSFGENVRGGVAAEWVYGVKEAQGVSWVKVPKGGPHPAVPVALSRGMGMSFPALFLTKLGTLRKFSDGFSFYFK